MKLKRTVLAVRGLFVSCVLAGVSALSVPHATASVGEDPQSPTQQVEHVGAAAPVSGVTVDQLQQAFEELKQSDLPRRQEVVDGQSVTFFTLPTGMEIAFPDTDQAAQELNRPQPYVSGGRSGLSGFWVEFTPREQDLLISGGGFVLGAAICAIPAVGQVACIVIGAVITGAAWAISSYGKCNTRLRVEFGWNGSVRSARCT